MKVPGLVTQGMTSHCTQECDRRHLSTGTKGASGGQPRSPSPLFSSLCLLLSPHISLPSLSSPLSLSSPPAPFLTLRGRRRRERTGADGELTVVGSHASVTEAHPGLCVRCAPPRGDVARDSRAGVITGTHSQELSDEAGRHLHHGSPALQTETKTVHCRPSPAWRWRLL